MKDAVWLSVIVVIVVVTVLGLGSFATWRNALREFGYGYWLRLTVGLIVLVWIIYGISLLGITL
ncbi:hypothetical protein H6W05_003552 [Salmonella enterica]|nr:hypothetical protein [Salmonella enterica]EKB5039430.1 hypothetical protein [Salmonella enterica]EME1065106.1 hypothetical protein [Salmonella enterica]